MWWIIVRNNGAESFKGSRIEVFVKSSQRRKQGYKAKVLGSYSSEDKMTDALADILMEQEKDNPIIIRK